MSISRLKRQYYCFQHNCRRHFNKREYFYNTKLVIQSFGGKSLGVQGSAQNIQPQQQAAPVPQGPVDVAERKDAPKTGRGKVVIEEFSDFQCPFCQKFFNDTYKQIKTKYIDTGKATFVFRHFPLPIHQKRAKSRRGGGVC